MKRKIVKRIYQFKNFEKKIDEQANEVFENVKKIENFRKIVKLTQVPIG